MKPWRQAAPLVAHRVAIIGSRDYPRLVDVRAYVSGLPPGTVVISGGARGVDTYAMNCARHYRLAVEIYEPDYKTYGRRAPLVRNHAIVNACSRLVAFWDGKSRSTADTIRLARKLGKPVQVFGGPDGAPPPVERAP